MNNDKNSRRFFIKALGFALGSACLGLWGSMVNKEQEKAGKKTISVSLDTNREVLFLEDCIVINKDQPRVYSSHCTHLGCRIQQFENGHLICPCHGSVFDLDGNPLKGPAMKPLREFEYKFNPDTNTLTINV